MKRISLLLSALAIVLLIALSQCKKDKNLPKPCFTVQGDSVSVGSAINFVNCSAGGNSYQWSFGDGQVSSSDSPTHAYAAGGNYTVTLTATNADGSAATSKVVYIVQCNPGYEGANCAVETRAKFIGNYQASERGSLSGNYIFPVTISNSSADITKVMLGNIYDTYTNPVAATVSDTTFTIASQDPDGQGYVVSGAGRISRTTISLTYSISYQGQTDNVTGTWTKQ